MEKEEKKLEPVTTLKDNNDELIKELDEIINDVWSQVGSQLKANKEIAIITEINFFVEDKRIKTLLAEYGLNAEKFDIKMEVSSNKYIGNKCKYYYDNVEIQPESYFLRPQGCREVTTLQMLRECEKQNTYKPKIYHLQDPIDKEE